MRQHPSPDAVGLDRPGPRPARDIRRSVRPEAQRPQGRCRHRSPTYRKALRHDTRLENAMERPRIEAWHEQEASYSLLFVQNPTPMWLIDDETLAFLEVNDAAVRHYGYMREEFLRMALKDIRPPEDIPRLLAYYQRALEAQCQGRIGQAGLWRHRTKDGTLIDVDINWSTVVFRGRKAHLIIAHDVTERVRAEAALRASYEELGRRVQERTAALARTNAALQAEVAERARGLRRRCGIRRSACVYAFRRAR